jgi:glutathione S-transferase
VFGNYDVVRTLNPAVKVPTLVCDDGTVLMDSGLILDYLEASAGRSLWPADLAQRRRALRVAGLSLAACEKVGQMHLEKHGRPAEFRYEGWFMRIRQQLAGALASLDAALAEEPLALEESHIGHAAIAAAVAWRCVQIKVADDVLPAYPTLADFSARAERLPVFMAAPADEQAVMAPA